MAGLYEQDIQFTASLSIMKKTTSLVAMAILIASFNLSALNSASAATFTPQTLATKIAKAGLGCKTITQKTSMIFGGTRLNCVANGENISIEVYPANKWKSVQGVACSLGVGFIAVTDNKSWFVTPESRSTALLLEKPLGAKMKVFCNTKNIINESKNVGPDKVSVPSNSTDSRGSLKTPLHIGESVTSDSFQVTVLGYLSDTSASVCSEASKRYLLLPHCVESGGQVVPDPMDSSKYIGITVKVKNIGPDMSWATYSGVFQVSTPSGTVNDQTFANIGPNPLLEELLPGGELTVTLYFVEPKSAELSKILFIVRQDGQLIKYFTLV